MSRDVRLETNPEIAPEKQAGTIRARVEGNNRATRTARTKIGGKITL
jgi:hypothetical protein